MVGSPPQLWYHSTICFNAGPYGNPPLQKKIGKIEKHLCQLSHHFTIILHMLLYFVGVDIKYIYICFLKYFHVYIYICMYLNKYLHYIGKIWYCDFTKLNSE